MCFDHIETTMEYCILHKLCPTTQFDWEDISIIKSRQDFSRNKPQGIMKEHNTQRRRTLEKFTIELIYECCLYFYLVQLGKKCDVL